MIFCVVHNFKITVALLFQLNWLHESQDIHKKFLQENSYKTNIIKNTQTHRHTKEPNSCMEAGIYLSHVVLNFVKFNFMLLVSIPFFPHIFNEPTQVNLSLSLFLLFYLYSPHPTWFLTHLFKLQNSSKINIPYFSTFQPLSPLLSSPFVPNVTLFLF